MRVYSIKRTRKQKKKQRSCFTAFKNSVFTSIGKYTALQTVDVQELVSVQQMTSGSEVVVRRIVWQYKYFF
jgi:hypothetical protein